MTSKEAAEEASKRDRLLVLAASSAEITGLDLILAVLTRLLRVLARRVISAQAASATPMLFAVLWFAARAMSRDLTHAARGLSVRARPSKRPGFSNLWPITALKVGPELPSAPSASK